MWKWNGMWRQDLTALCSATLAMTLSLKSIFWLAVSSLKKEENFKFVDKDRPKEYQNSGRHKYLVTCSSVASLATIHLAIASFFSFLNTFSLKVHVGFYSTSSLVYVCTPIEKTRGLQRWV